MKNSAWMLILGCTLCCLLACTPPATSTDEQETTGTSSPEMQDRADEGAVIAAHKALIRAFQEGDRDAIVALVDPTPEMLIFHPLLENRFDGREETGEGLDRMFGRLTGIEWTEVHPLVSIHGDVAWITSQILIKADGMDQPFIGRGTEIWKRRGEEWQLVHGHWSEHARLAGEEE